MKELLRLLFVNACVIVGVNFVTSKDQLLGPLGDQIRKLPKNVSHPISECPPCMSSVWGTAMYWLFGPRKLLLWPFYVLSLCGFVRLVNLALEALKRESRT